MTAPTVMEDPFRDHPKLAMENHLMAIDGLADALSLMAGSPELQESQKRAIDAIATAIQERHNALWKLLFENGSADA